MTPKQFMAFLTPNEMGEIENSSNAAVKIMKDRAEIEGQLDLSDPTNAEALAGFFTPDRAAAFQQYAAGLPVPLDLTAAGFTAAGFTDAQAALLAAAFNQ